MNYEATEDCARRLDEADELAGYRRQFHFPRRGTPETIYFTGHSLGLQPKSARAAIDTELEKWADYAVDGHFHAAEPWYDYHELLTPAMAQIVGARDSEVVCMNSLTTNIHLLFVSFYRPSGRRFKILSDAPMFPSDRYLLETQTRFHGFDPDEAIVEVSPREGEGLLREDDVVDAIRAAGDELAMVFISGVNYLTGQRFDIERLAAEAHAAGAVAGFDLAHAAGNVPLALHDWDVDFAAWCSYKYLNAGPGNAGAIFVHERHGRRFDLPRFGGWWGHNKDTRFQMKPPFEPMAGAEGWLVSNSNIIGLAAMRAALEMFAEVGMDAVRGKSVRLTAYLEHTIDVLAEEFPDAEISIVTPRDPDRRGAQLSMDIAGRDRALFERMLARGIIGDFREPCIIRMAPVPLYNSFTDVYRFGAVLRELL